MLSVTSVVQSSVTARPADAIAFSSLTCRSDRPRVEKPGRIAAVRDGAVSWAGEWVDGGDLPRKAEIAATGLEPVTRGL